MGCPVSVIDKIDSMARTIQAHEGEARFHQLHMRINQEASDRHMMMLEKACNATKENFRKKGVAESDGGGMTQSNASAAPSPPALPSKLDQYLSHLVACTLSMAPLVIVYFFSVHLSGIAHLKYDLSNGADCNKQTLGLDRA